MSVENVGLVEDAGYEGQGVMVKHADLENPLPLVKTSKKVLYVQDGERLRKVSLGKVENVEVPAGVEPVLKEEEVPSAEPMGDTGLLSNTNYEGQGVRVNHVDYEDNEFELVRTSEKLLFFRDNQGNVCRMTQKKLSNVIFD